jgi:mRNA interferase MazF
MVKKNSYVPDRGEVVWVDLNPTRGHEQRDTRPALVLSPRRYNKKTGLMLVVPITSQVKGYPFEVRIETEQVSGAILADQPCTLDWHARRVRFMVNVSHEMVASVQARLVALISE